MLIRAGTLLVHLTISFNTIWATEKLNMAAEYMNRGACIIHCVPSRAKGDG